jgi:response regulator RpfG family c-di-GMP phosphodiesterase
MPESVLIVDDQNINIEILKGILVDYKIKTAINGKQALQVAKSDDPPDIILLDIMMPEMDGYETISHLKEDEKTRGIPVIFVTTLSKISDESKGLDLGAVDYIHKPLSPAIVLARVKTHLKMKKAHQQEIENHRLKHDLVKAKASKIGAQNMVAVLDTTVNTVVHMLADAATSITFIERCFVSGTLDKQKVDAAVGDMFKALEKIENISSADGLKFNQTEEGIQFEIGEGEFKFSNQYRTLSE